MTNKPTAIPAIAPLFRITASSVNTVVPMCVCAHRAVSSVPHNEIYNSLEDLPLTILSTVMTSDEETFNLTSSPNSICTVQHPINGFFNITV